MRRLPGIPGDPHPGGVVSPPKGACAYHVGEPVEAESLVSHGLTYVVLRCRECDRTRGQRIVHTARPPIVLNVPRFSL